jgi:hypothetical protein
MQKIYRDQSGIHNPNRYKIWEVRIDEQSPWYIVVYKCPGRFGKTFSYSLKVYRLDNQNRSFIARKRNIIFQTTDEPFNDDTDWMDIEAAIKLHMEGSIAKRKEKEAREVRLAQWRKELKVQAGKEKKIKKQRRTVIMKRLKIKVKASYFKEKGL